MALNFHRFFKALKATVMYTLLLSCITMCAGSGVEGSGFLDEIFSSWFLYGMTVINQTNLRNKQPFV